jgi:hypothetical protein
MMSIPAWRRVSTADARRQRKVLGLLDAGKNEQRCNCVFLLP